MADKFKRLDSVPVGNLFLALDNPRFDPVDAEPKAIEELCNNENVYPIARDIARIGINPLELFALVPVDRNDPDGPKTNYYVAEGNRRLCAIKLLNDPDLAPAKLRQGFERIAATWTPIKAVAGIVFRDDEALRTWRDRLHNGEQGGIGRKRWDATQKSRNDSGNKNRPALALLDYAEREGMITAAQRERKLTTVQRFLSNAVFRETLGLDTAGDADISRNRPKEEFDVVAKRFISDLIVGKDVHSRMNKKDIDEYARPLGSLSGVTPARIPPESISTEASAARVGSATKKHQSKPNITRRVSYDHEIGTALINLNNQKLRSLYHSITAIELVHHTPLVTVGVWCFFETLTACCGRIETTSLDSFVSKSRLQSFGLGDDAKTYRPILERIRDFGNATKHHAVAASFASEQLNNDMVVMKPVVLALIGAAAREVP